MFGSVDISVYIYISINLNDKIMSIAEIRSDRHVENNKFRFDPKTRELISQRIRQMETDIEEMKNTAKKCISENYMESAKIYCNRIIQKQNEVLELRKKL